MLENKMNRILWCLAIFLTLTVCIVILQPLHNKYLCLITLLLFLCLFSVIFVLFKQYKWFKIALPTVALACLGILLNQSKIDSKTLSSLYINQLISFNNVPYVWGGESGFGIDCSGLPRKSLVNALLLYSVSHFNGTAFLKAIDYWWNDASALEMTRGYNGRMTVSDHVFTINESAKLSISPGDLAVTENGVHVMVFLDSKHVIQAEPGAGKVIIHDVPSANSWLQHNVKLVRWSCFDIF